VSDSAAFASSIAISPLLRSHEKKTSDMIFSLPTGVTMDVEGTATRIGPSFGCVPSRISQMSGELGSGGCAAGGAGFCARAGKACVARRSMIRRRARGIPPFYFPPGSPSIQVVRTWSFASRATRLARFPAAMRPISPSSPRNSAG